MHEAIKSKLHSCNSCCSLLQNLLSSRLMPMDNKLHGCAPKQCLVICYKEMEGINPTHVTFLNGIIDLYTVYFTPKIAFAVFTLLHTIQVATI